MNQWQSMVMDLKEAGLTQAQIATEMSCSQNYVSNLENGLCGKRLGYEKGEGLKKLWTERCSTKQPLKVSQ